jgi:PPM family protein phosphatase
MSDGQSKPLVVCAAACTDNGRVRDHNEDYISYCIPEPASRAAAYGALFLVCDGVGGGVSGEVASKHAGQRILDEYYQAPVEQAPAARLGDAIRRANELIFQENREQPEGRRMTTTVVAALVVGSQLYLAHTGDSRAYLVSRGQIAQVTRDHSWVAELVRSGDLTPAEAESHPWRNRITRALGMSESADVEQKVLDLVEGDILLLCSDGLTRHVSEPELLDVVTHSPPPQATRRLADLANERGGLDNISVIIAELSAPDTACGREFLQHQHQQ